MAPTKKQANQKLKATKQSNDRVAKRPARGFHRSKNGMLNVTPKGGERALVKQNQNSLLLRLPTELRQQIWEYVLGYELLDLESIVKGETHTKVAAPASDRTAGLDLLRTCRQIYSETAILPYSKNVYCFPRWASIKPLLKGFKQYQLANTTRIQLKVYNNWDLFISTDRGKILSFLPALKQVRLVILCAVFSQSTLRLEHEKEKTRKQLGVLLAGRKVEIVFESTESFWREYVARWEYPTH